MKNSYIIETKHFKFTNNEIHLLRGKYTYKKIGFSEISKIELKKGVAVKRPLILFLLGFLFISISVLIVQGSFNILDEIMTDFIFEEVNVDNYEVFVVTILALGIFMSLGLKAIFHATFPTKILRVFFSKNKYEVFPLGRLGSSKKLTMFIQFLQDNFRNKFIIR